MPIAMQQNDDALLEAETGFCPCCRVCHLDRDATAGAIKDAKLGHEHSDAGGRHDHTSHEGMFRRRFWISLALSVPVLIWSPTIEGWFGYSASEFTGSGLIVPVLSRLDHDRRRCRAR